MARPASDATASQPPKEPARFQPLPSITPVRAKAADHQHREGHRFEADRQHQGNEDAAERGGHGVLLPHRSGKAGKGKRDLYVVVIDAARLKLDLRRQRHGGKGDGDEGRPLAAELSRDEGDRRHRGQKPQQRPDETHEPFRPRRPGKRPRCQVKPGKAGVDQPRPVRDIPLRRLQAGDAHVVPAMAGKEGARLDETHGIVAVAETDIEARRAGPHLEGDDGQPGQDDP